MAGLRYLGRGEFIPGVPARDLTAEEAAQFRAVIEEHRRNTGRALYGPPVPVSVSASLEHEDTETSGGAERGDAEAPTPKRAGGRKDDGATRVGNE